MSAVTMVKSHENKNFKIGSRWQFSKILVKCRQNQNFKKMDTTASYTGKMIGFDYCEEYLRSISNEILLRQC